jgi:hypothetical protein
MHQNLQCLAFFESLVFLFSLGLLTKWTLRMEENGVYFCEKVRTDGRVWKQGTVFAKPPIQRKRSRALGGKAQLLENILKELSEDEEDTLLRAYVKKGSKYLLVKKHEDMMLSMDPVE